MKILKILGIVAAVHVVAVALLFAIQGCSSTSKSTPSSTAATADNAPATVQFNGASDTSSAVPASTSGNGADLNPAPTPATSTISFNDSPTLYSPTRPGTPAAVAIATTEPVTNVTPAATYAVAKGDSLSKIAAKYHLTAIELAKANNLKLSSPLQIGQKLLIPGKAVAPGGAEAAPATGGTMTYTVKSGDSLKLIARRNGTTVSAIKSLNRLKSDTVRVGQELKLPPGATPVPSAPAVVDTTSASAPVSAVPDTVKGTGGLLTHTVKSGEKLSTIAKKYGVTLAELATANNISDPSKIRAGQELVIPNGSSAGGKSVKAGAITAAPPPSTTTPDVDTGLKPAAEEPPVIKVDDSSSSEAPAPSSNPDDSSAPKNQ
jgi:LysM repeat protein